MDRRSFLRALAAGGTSISAGCAGSRSAFDDSPDASATISDGPERAGVFETHRFNGTELVVRFRDGVDVRRVVLGSRLSEATYETIEQPADVVRFPVVFPDRLETRVSGSLAVSAETATGWARKWVPGTVHGAVRNVAALSDGRARFEIENRGNAPLLVRFVGIYGDVPNPTIAQQRDAVDWSSLDRDPNVVGVGRNRPRSSSRTDLAVAPGEAAPFETTDAPFAFPDGADADDCDGRERSARIAVVNASGGATTETVTVRLEGDSVVGDGRATTADDRPTAAGCRRAGDE